MKCCDDIQNLGCFDACEGVIETTLTANIQGTWKIEISYMGITEKQSLDLEENETIKINISNLNEDYTYNMTIKAPDGTAFNNMCYSFTTYKTICK